MPNRDGVDTGSHPNRQVGYHNWRPSNNAMAPAGSQRAASLDMAGPHMPYGEVSVKPTQYGWDANHERSEFSPGLTRREAFEEVSQYTAGPFRTEHRAKTAALAMSQRDESKLGQYSSGSKTNAIGPDHDY